jgi:hypothetical protein
MVCELEIMFSIEIWGLNGAWKEVDKVHIRFCKKIIGVSNCAADGFAEMELAMGCRRGKCLGQVLKYWYHVMCLESEEVVKHCYEWQKCNMGIGSWAV